MDHNQQYIDNLFRNKLSDYQVDPPSGIWQNIVRRKKSAALRRKTLLLLLLALLLFLLIGLLWNYNSTDNLEDLAGSSPQMEMADKSSYQPSHSEKSTGFLDAEESLNDLKEDSKNNNSNRSNEGANPIITETNANSTSERNRNSTSKDKISSASSTSISSRSDHRQVNSENASALGKSNQLTGGESDVTKSTTLFTPSEESLSGDFTSEKLYSNPLDEKTNELNFQSQNTDLMESEILGEISGQKNLLADGYKKEEISMLEMAPLRERSTSVSLLQRNSAENATGLSFNACAIRNNPNCFEPLIPIRHFTLDILGGPDFYQKTLNPKTTEGQELAEMRRATESYAFSYGLSLRLSAVFESGLALRTGLFINQINEKFQFVDPDEQRSRVINVLIDTLITGPMDTTFVFDTLSVIESGTRVRTVYNRYQMIDLPLMIGTEFQSGKWTITSSAGVLINLAFSKRGEVLSASGKPRSFPDGESENDIFRAKLGLSLVGGFGVGYQIDSRYSLMLESRIKYNLKPLTIDDYPIEQNYFVIGFQGGLRYKFK